MDHAEASRVRASARRARKRKRREERDEHASDSEPEQQASDESASASDEGGENHPAADADKSESDEVADIEVEQIEGVDGGAGDQNLDDFREIENPFVSDQSSQHETSSAESSGEEDEEAYTGSESDVTDSDAESEVGSEHATDSESSSDEENGEENGDQLIYPGAPITLRESLVAIFSLMSTENLSGKLVGCILSLIALHCPPGSIVKKTLYQFKKYFHNIGSALMVFHYYCENCINPVKTKESVCGKCRGTGDNITFFLELPLVNQLQHMFRRENFYQDLQFRFRADRKHTACNIEDIYDGRIYQKEMENNGFLSNPSNVSFMWYSDGVKIFKSASYSIWPLCLVVNELPYKKRTLPENMLLFGLWFGKHKPSPNVFLHPLVATMKKLEKDGHNFKLSDNNDINVKCKIICGTCDMPAKSKFLQFKQYNGEYGCPKCLSSGGRFAVGRTTIQVYPYSADTQMRTHEQTKEHAQDALELRRRDKNASVFGVKGPSLLSKLVPDLIRCTAIDVMHGCFLGVCKLLMDLWFSSTYSNQPWSLHHLFGVVEDKLRKIKPPSHAVRAPRSLSDLKFWKASEFKLFLLYYSIPVLKNVMEEPYLQHHCKLVSGITLLSQDSISLDQVRAASALLISYVSDFARLYHVRFMGINVHQLLHLPDVVLDLGPLFVYSTFFLESYNGTINKFFHGTQHVAFQICSTVAMILQVPLIKKTIPIDSEALKFCKALDAGRPFKLAGVIHEATFAVGKYGTNHHQIEHSKMVLRQTLNIDSGQCYNFYKMQKQGVMYFSEEYGLVSKRNESSFVSYLQDDNRQLGRIVRFVKWSHCRNVCEIGCHDCHSSFYAIIREYKRVLWFVHDYRDIRLTYLWRVERTEKVVAVDVKILCNVCFYIEVNGETYMACPVNRLEIE